MTASALYFGRLTHHRFTPQRHDFGIGLYMLLLDLDELPELFDGVPGWSARRPALAWLRRGDFLDGGTRPLADTARDLVQERLGMRPAGPVRVLTHLRYFGYQINPIRIYWLFDAAGERVEALIAEVTNTPWGERHCYVLPAPEPDSQGALRLRFDKAMHVSPFMPMDQHYEWRLAIPRSTLAGGTLASTLDCVTRAEVTLTAAMILERRTLDRRRLLAALAAHPFMTARIAWTIYWQALRLHRKKVPVHPHPGGRGP